MRHVAILGMSFCGSTVLSYVLGVLPGCATIGESHWLADPHPATGKPLGCMRCKSSCPVITDELRARLRTGPWYPTIADALGAEILISSDKSPEHIERFAPARDYDAIVLFRHPARQLASHARVFGEPGGAFDDASWLSGWRRFYGRLLYAFALAGRTRFVCFDDFAAAPEPVLADLAGWLGVAFDAAALEYWRLPHHVVGGNFNPFACNRLDPARLPIRPREAPAGTVDAASLALFAALNATCRGR